MLALWFFEVTLFWDVIFHQDMGTLTAVLFLPLLYRATPSHKLDALALSSKRQPLLNSCDYLTIETITQARPMEIIAPAVSDFSYCCLALLHVTCSICQLYMKTKRGGTSNLSSSAGQHIRGQCYCWLFLQGYMHINIKTPRNIPVNSIIWEGYHTMII